MNKPTPIHATPLGGALVASLIVGVLYASGGWPRAFAGLLLLAILITPGPGGTSALAGLLDLISNALRGVVQ